MLFINRYLKFKFILLVIFSIVVFFACQGNVFSLEVGDCYNAPAVSTDYSTEISDVDLVDCSELHSNEVYAIFELPDTTWKSDDYTAELAGTGCANRFQDFIGLEYDLSTLWIDYIFPLEESWATSREVSCSVLPESGKVSGSLKGSKR